MRNVTANILPALPPEQLALTRYVSATFKAVFIGTVAFFFENSARDTEVGICCKLSEQKLEMVRIEGNITIQITDDLPPESFYSFIPHIEGSHLTGKIAITSI